MIPHRFKVDLPDDLVVEIIKCKDNQAVKQVGIEWSIQQCKELKAKGVPALHFYSMGKSDNIKTVAQAIF
ncbi:Methylenetetrahydrofolate reductase [compost metagenome]